MDTNILKAYWKEAKGKLKEQWSKLTDDDLMAIDGDIDKLTATLQKYYSYTKEEAMAKAKEFKDKCKQNMDPNNPTDSSETENIDQAAHKVSDFSKNLYKETKEAAEHLKNEATEYGQAAAEFIEKKPYQSLAIAAVSGLLLGFICKSMKLR